MAEQNSQHDQTSGSAEFQKVNARLKFEVTELKQKQHETSQRIWIKWILLVIGVAAMSFMVTLIYHMVFNIDIVSQSTDNFLSSAAVLAVPTASFTFTFIALVYGANRKFEESDLTTVAKEAAKSAVAGS